MSRNGDEKAMAARIRQELEGRTFTGMIHYLETGGFGWKLRSGIVDGNRVYYARVYIEQESGRAPKFKADTPATALREAYITYLIHRKRIAQIARIQREAAALEAGAA